MNLHGILLGCAALLPAMVLCIYIFKKDRVEKEPVGLLMGLLLLGALVSVPVIWVGSVLDNAIFAVFAPFATEVDGQLYLDGWGFKLYHACEYFIGVALVEEGFKFLAMFFVTRNNKNFNSLFDGIVYAVFVSLGFAALENILYVFNYGWGTAAMRAVLSVPGHMFFGVLMGYYYSFWHMHVKARELERTLKCRELIPAGNTEFSCGPFLARSLIMPILAHGMYDYCCAYGTLMAILVFLAFVVFLYIYCFKQVRIMSLFDMEEKKFYTIMVLKKYPQLETLIDNDSRV